MYPLLQTVLAGVRAGVGGGPRGHRAPRPLQTTAEVGEVLTLPTTDSSVTGVMANICPAHKSVTILLSILPQNSAKSTHGSSESAA